MNSVSPFFDIPPDRLESTIRNIASMTKRSFRGTVLWSVVGAALGHGSGVSRELCRHAGLDPDSILPNIKSLP